jgi:hypothetical protein
VIWLDKVYGNYKQLNATQCDDDDGLIANIITNRTPKMEPPQAEAVFIDPGLDSDPDDTPAIL